MAEDPTIWMESAVAEDGYPFCLVKWGDMKGQLSVEEMREHARRAFEVAEAAEHDAAYYQFLQRELDVPKVKAAMLVGELRKYRSKHQGFQWNTKDGA